MKQLLPLTLTLILILFYVELAVAEGVVVVVANKDNQMKVLTKKQVIDIYMGRTSLFPNGQAALPLDQNSDSSIRKLFYQNLVNKTVSEINAYWARLLFSGRASPPRTVESVTSVINIIKNNKAAIGYIQLEDLTNDVQVITYVD
jgi:ABC-type phosphate transport system substrate-binding protein